jgi:hypothetical protein
MSIERHSYSERRAYWEAFDGKCAICRNPIERLAVLQIDHVVNEGLREKPEELSAELEKLGLPNDFDLRSRLNKVASCWPCNSRKAASQDRLLRLELLKLARNCAPKVEALLERYAKEKRADKLLAQVGTAIDNRVVSLEEFSSFLGVSPIPVATSDSEILRIFGNASRALLNWPKTTRAIWLERPEISKLLDQLDKESSLTALLGEPGSGKSSLLSHLGEEVERLGIPCLALKADLLPPELESLAGLEEHVGSPEPISNCFKKLAEAGPVVFLIDQMDALSELMVQKSSRLTVLLKLIQELRGVENLHVFISCRTFEFHHDVRLLSLKPESVGLDDPPFQAIEPILRDAGVDYAAWPGVAKELLRRPQYLSFFVTHLANDGKVFTSYLAMMEEVFQRYVLARFGNAAVDTIESVADAMATEESLWLPASRWDSSKANIDRLVAADLLKLTENRLQIGFRHQTLFDFVRARMFVSGRASLSAYALQHQNSLFVRPTLWSALNYLREADRKRYRKDFESLWSNITLRKHLRFLLLEFLGTVRKPESFEVEIVRFGLCDEALKAKVVKSISGRSPWFTPILPELSGLMKEDAPLLAAAILRQAPVENGDKVIDFIDTYWIPHQKYDAFSLHVLCSLQCWTTQTVRVAATLVKRNPQHARIDMLVGHVGKSWPDIASKLIAIELRAKLELAEAERIAVPAIPENASVHDKVSHYLSYGDAAYKKVKAIVTDTNRWYGTAKIAESSPECFLKEVWPWVLQVANAYASPQSTQALIYRADPIWQDSDETDENLTFAIKASIAGLARLSPESFLAFAEQNMRSELMCVHRWIANGYAAIAATHSAECAGYLLGDSRRLHLGPWELPNEHPLQETEQLLSALVPSATRDDIRTLETMILKWAPYSTSASEYLESRRNWHRQNRMERLRLLKLLPIQSLSVTTTRVLQAEQRVFPYLPKRNPRAGRRMAQFVRSPVSANQMAFNSKEQLLRLFDELPDATDRHSSVDLSKGGVLETSRELGEMAKLQPEKAMSVLADLQPSKHQAYASKAVRSLSELDDPPAALVDSVHALAARGFDSADFINDASEALSNLARKQNGLSDESCALLKSWLVDRRPTDKLVSNSSEEGQKEGRSGRSIIWDNYGGARVLPQGNFTVLRALYDGYIMRETPDWDLWLSVLETHATRSKEPNVWSAVCRHLVVFPSEAAGQARVAGLLEKVFTKFGLINTQDAVFCIVLSRSRLPDSFVQTCLEQWQGGNWILGSQAAAEVAMLWYFWFPENEFCARFVQSIVDGGLVSVDRLSAMRAGLAFSAAQIFLQDSDGRATALRILLKLLPSDDADVLQAWSTVFGKTWIKSDEKSINDLLDAVLRSPGVLRTDYCRNLVQRLKESLGNRDPVRICRIAIAIADVRGSELANSTTAFAVATGELIDIALTLQRFPETSECGIELFERLMDTNYYSLDDTVRMLDRRL